MPQDLKTLDAPFPPPHRVHRRLLLALAAVVLVIIFSARTLLAEWVDLLWFHSLGYSQVFWRTTLLSAAVCIVFALLTFAILFTVFTLLRRSHAGDLPRSHKIYIQGSPLNLSIDPILRGVTWVIAIIAGFLSGTSMLASWPTFALYLYAPRASTVTDPVFSRPLSFFLFTLPMLNLLLNWLLTLAFVIGFAAIFMALLASSTRAVQARTEGADIHRYAPSLWRGLSWALAFFLLVLSANVYVSRFQTLLNTHTLFDGVTYTDAHILIPGLLFVALALLVGAGLAAYNAMRSGHGKAIFTSAVPAVVAYVALSLVGWYVDSFVVRPNQLDRETPYIAHNIQSTRAAFGLDRFDRKEFPAETTVAAADPANNQPTLQNIRLWDWHALQDTLRQVQEIRTYYDFPDIDIDRYNLDGTTREVMLAGRELNVNKLPDSSRNWINEKLIYTHGYGVTMNPVNGFTAEGLPNLLLSNMPVQSTVPGLSVSRPELYFGELTNTDVYVKTHQQEFDYPQGQSNNLTSYQGTGGIPIGGELRRILLATDRGDLGKVPFSDDITPDSRLLMRRNIRQRVAVLAPFLTFDSDPYLVVGEDGRLSWILDAYTASDSYPDATHYTLPDGTSVNYIRNSVKAVVDAYNGTTTFYVFDPSDPLIAAWRHIFPALFRDAVSMPPDLRHHIRYPETLFSLQAQVYALYHMTVPEVFFNREDLWTVATETTNQPTSDDSGQSGAQPMQPNFVLMKLPGETNAEFVEILPFTPANRNNLIGWIAARCDDPHYGSAIVYDFPKTRLIDGPQQIEARIDQNAQLSGQLTLWNQQGSHVLRGSLLVIPSGKALLYAEPIYLQAQQSPMPELRLVVLALQDRLAYGPNFQSALASLFNDQPSSLNATTSTDTDTSTPSATPSPAPTAAANNSALISQAAQDFDDYQHLTAAGKLTQAGQKLDDLKRVLNQLNQHSNTQAH
ncbi:UPF0182 family protein [Granulicella sp. 5B5]|uniref:UPF0182 family protein n=1 Tax=Granulicella sp. 5B5 TaxID=1617967 RepID=UPI0015F53799|nr:UPF0182 family protein [Granulicella sp. 5B5]QMV17633.1 UPF0182 family protein [Granulicella sp. 5B5]